MTMQTAMGLCKQVARYCYPGIRWEVSENLGSREFDLRGFYLETAAFIVISDRELHASQNPYDVLGHAADTVANYLVGLVQDGFDSPEEAQRFREWKARGEDLDFEEEDE